MEEEKRKKKKADLKVVILGDCDVGKTCLIHRYIDGVFVEGPPNVRNQSPVYFNRSMSQMTIGAAFFLKQYGPSNIAIWDTAGEEKFSGLSGFYCRNANAAIIAYDIRDESTFKSIDERHTKLLETAADNCLFVFVGTKLDLVTDENRQVSQSVAIARAKRMNEEKNSIKHPGGVVPFFETSAKTGEKVMDVFEYIFETLVPQSAAYQTTKTASVNLDDRRTKKKSCC